MKIPLCRPTLTDEMKKVALEVLESRRYIKGPRAKDLERSFADYCGVKYATTVSNGSVALLVALKALDVGNDDEVIVPSHTFISTATSIVLAGAKPVFAEIDDSFNMNMDKLEEKITDKTKAVIPVHLYGQMCDMDKLIELKKKHGFFIIEDSCQAHGAEYRGKKSGSFGDINCFSFFPSKNMTVCGDGGIVVTDDENLDKKTKMFRDHGRDYTNKTGKYLHETLGFNFRLSEISGAIGKIQLEHLDGWIERRRKIAKLYDELLTDKVMKPVELKDRKHVYYLYVIRTEKRDELKEFLKNEEIESGIHYPIPLHKQPIFMPNNISLPKTELICSQILSLPMFPQLNDEEIKHICEKINSFFADS